MEIFPQVQSEKELLNIYHEYLPLPSGRSWKVNDVRVLTATEAKRERIPDTDEDIRRVVSKLNMENNMFRNPTHRLHNGLERRIESACPLRPLTYLLFISHSPKGSSRLSGHTSRTQEEYYALKSVSGQEAAEDNFRLFEAFLEDRLSMVQSELVDPDTPPPPEHTHNQLTKPKTPKA